ncbi:MAG: DEAD/DEAH box helicase [Candidatus Brocadiaceae baterium WH-1]|nr:MAG: DEAD/DEAH box helicase [Candidatus Jettenia sp. AMX2]
MQITPYHAKYFAFELTKHNSSDSLQKLASSLLDAQVDLNPHQVEAALFAFRSPLSKGAILADEVRLGKTIEAGLVISQKWAERKRKFIIIVPAHLCKQWNQELSEKFFHTSIILEASSFNQEIKKGNLNPFDQKEIIICSYHFARAKDAYIKKINWDLVVIDEAHRLRNVYKPQNKIANTIKDAIAHAPKVLLTATPLQNSFLEIYGLVSIIDDYTLPATISPLLGGDLGVGSHIRYLINHIAQKHQAEILQMNTERNAGFFDNEMEKLDKWAENVKGSMEIELKELDKEIKCRKTEAKKS